MFVSTFVLGVLMTRTVYVSAIDNFWRTHTENESIGEVYVLQSTALATAIRYVTSMGEGRCDQIKVQRKDGSYRTVWMYGKDPYPPKKIPLRKNKYNHNPDKNG